MLTPSSALGSYATNLVGHAHQCPGLQNYHDLGGHIGCLSGFFWAES